MNIKYCIVLLIFSFAIVSKVFCQINQSVSEAELRAFFDKELQKFKNIKIDTSIEVKKIYDITNYVRANTSKIDLSSSNIKNLDWYNIEKRLLLPFKQEKISTDLFLNVLDTLNDKLAEFVPLYFQKYKFNQFNSDDELLNKVIQLSQNYSQTKDYLVRATQRPEESKQEIVDSLQSKSFYKLSHPEVDILLARFASLGDNDETIKILENVILQLPKNTRLRWNVPGEQVNVFEKLLNSGNNEIKTTALKLLYRFLDKAAISAALQFEYILSQQISEEIKYLSESKYRNLQEMNDSEEFLKEKNLFFKNYLSHYARNHRTSSIPLIEKALIPDSSKIELEENQVNFRIKDYKDEVVIRNGMAALINLSELKDLTEPEKNEILASLRKSNLVNAVGYYWRNAIKIIQNLHPQSTFDDYSNLFSNVSESSEYTSIKDYWNRKTYSVSELDNYLEFFNSIGFDTTQIDNSKRNAFQKKYRNDDRITVIWGVLDLLEISVNYDCETGVWPNPYDDLINLYLMKSNELEDFYPIFEYKETGEEYRTTYTTILTNGKYGYLTKPKDFGDWYDPNTIEAMLNTCLKELGDYKRFVQLETGDQTVLSVYAEPGQIKKIVERFDMELVNQY